MKNFILAERIEESRTRRERRVVAPKELFAVVRKREGYLTPKLQARLSRAHRVLICMVESSSHCRKGLKMSFNDCCLQIWCSEGLGLLVWISNQKALPSVTYVAVTVSNCREEGVYFSLQFQVIVHPCGEIKAGTPCS